MVQPIHNDVAFILFNIKNHLSSDWARRSCETENMLKFVGFYINLFQAERKLMTKKFEPLKRIGYFFMSGGYILSNLVGDEEDIAKHYSPQLDRDERLQ